MNKSGLQSWAGRLLGLCLLLAPGLSGAAWDDDKGCLSCHEGIERIADTPTM